MLSFCEAEGSFSADCDIALLDCGLEAERGIKLLRYIKTLHPEAPVLFLTDASSENTAVTAFRAGARDYFKKPVNLAELRYKMEKLLYLKKASKERRTGLNDFFKINSLSGKDSTQMPPGIIRAVSIIERELSGDITLERLATEAAMSKFHFLRLFKRHMGDTPKRFILRLRVERAKKMLKKDESVSNLAYDLGFGSVNGFERQFKKYVGVTPSSFKASI